jgi:hypothetical protein
MFVVAFEGVWLGGRSIVLWVLGAVFVFAVDVDAVERNNMPFCRERWRL